MALASRYPFADFKGQWIPADILKSNGAYRKDFAAGATSVDSLPVGTEVIRIRCTQNAWIRLDGTVASIPVHHATASVLIPYTVYLLANISYVIAIPSIQYSIIRDTVDGYAIIEIIEKWNALALEVQAVQT